MAIKKMFMNVKTFTSTIFRIGEYLPSATKLRRLCFYTCLSFCSQGWGSASVHAGTPPPPRAGTPWEQTPPRSGTPPNQAPPGSRHPLEHTPPQTRNTPRSRQPPPPGAETATAADGTHPTGMHSCWLFF